MIQGGSKSSVSASLAASRSAEWPIRTSEPETASARCAHRLLQRCADLGIGFMSGVPCSFLAALFAALEQSVPGIAYYPAPREDVALGFAAGCYLAGGLAAVALQNSGLGHTVNPLTSLHRVYRIPVLLIVGWRGREPAQDAPEHRYMGPATPALLRDLGVRYVTASRATIGACVNQVAPVLHAAELAAILVPPGVLD